MTIELKLNSYKMGLMPRSSKTREWYTAEVGKLGAIHVHNDTDSGKWAYRITTIRTMDSKHEFDTKAEAFVDAVAKFARMVIRAKYEIEDALGIDL